MKSLFFSIGLAIAAVLGPTAAKTCSAQPLGTNCYSLEWLVASSDVVVRATIAGVASGPSGKVKITLTVAETLKGEPAKAITFADETRYNQNETYDLWKNAKTEALWFLVRDKDGAGGKANDKSRPELRPLGLDSNRRSAIRLGPATGGTSHRESSLPAVSMNLQSLSKPRQILDAAKAAVAEGGNRQRLRGHLIATDPYMLSHLTVPVDRRLEKLAQRFIRSPDDILRPQVTDRPEKSDPSQLQPLPPPKPKPLDEKEEKIRLQELQHSQDQFRIEGAKALRYFKSDENIALLKPLLGDPAYRTPTMGEDQESAAELREYYVRNEAFTTLRGWGVDVAQPVLQEWVPKERVYPKKELPAHIVEAHSEGKPKSNILYYFTNRYNMGSEAGARKLPGLYRSDDRGKTWRLWCIDFEFKQLFMHPETGVLFAAVDAPSLANDKEGFLRSVSGGEKVVMSSDGRHWKDITPGRRTVPRIEGFEIDRDHPRRVCMNVGYMTGGSDALARAFFVQPADDEYVKWDWYVVAYHSPLKEKVAATRNNLQEEKTTLTGNSRQAGLAGAKLREAQFSRDGKSLLALGDSLDVWDLESGKAVRRLGSVRSDVVAFSPGNRRVVTGSQAPGPYQQGVPAYLGQITFTISALNVADGKELWHDTSFGQLHSAMFSPDEKRMVTVSGASAGAVVDTETGKKLFSFDVYHSGLHDFCPWGLPSLLFDASFSPDGNQIVTIDGSGVAVHDAKTGRKLHQYNHRGIINSAVFSPDGQRVVMTYDKIARTWDSRTGKLLQEFRGHDEDVESAVFSPDGTMVLTASKDGSVRLWNAATAAAIRRWTCDGRVHYAMFSADGRRVLAKWGKANPQNVNNDRSSNASLWDRETGREVGRFSLGVHSGLAIFSPNGKRVFTASGEAGPVLWDAETGEVIRRYE